MRRFILEEEASDLITMLRHMDAILVDTGSFWWRVRKLWAAGAERYLGSGMPELEKKSINLDGLLVEAAVMRAFLGSSGQLYEGIFEAWSDSRLSRCIASFDGMDQSVWQIETEDLWFGNELSKRGIREVISFR